MISDLALYKVWSTMKDRCENKHHAKYATYGARGICVCDEWHNLENFIRWAYAHEYRRGLQIDRIDNDGGYYPDNCRFVTSKQNNRNRRNTKYLTINGETKCVSEWCETTPISPKTIYWWYSKFGREYAEQKAEERLRQQC